ncbi:MAG: hypothetical protein RL291_270, partial [Pseudomonadota bacterium]
VMLGDGLNWRRAVDPNFDPAVALPAVLKVADMLVNPATPASASGNASTNPLPQRSTAEPKP